MIRKHVLIKSKIEYVTHAANFCDGCRHGCLYPCYAMRMKRWNYHDWRHNPKPVPDAGRILAADLDGLKEAPGDVLVSSTHDPYQPGDGLSTREVLEVLAERRIPTSVLTKGDLRRVLRDFDLLQRPEARAGVTITTLNEHMRERWEPGAASVHCRFLVLVNAAHRGVKTWVSVEPILPGLDLFGLARRLQGLADWVVIGKWNYHRMAEVIDWRRVREEAEEAFEPWGDALLIKKELAEA